MFKKKKCIRRWVCLPPKQTRGENTKLCSCPSLNSLERIHFMFKMDQATKDALGLFPFFNRLMTLFFIIRTTHQCLNLGWVVVGGSHSLFCIACCSESNGIPLAYRSNKNRVLPDLDICTFQSSYYPSGQWFELHVNKNVKVNQILMINSIHNFHNLEPRLEMHVRMILPKS
jgi:hypothetical protein